MRRAIDFLLLATTILVVLCVLGQGECSKKESDQSNSSNSTSKNFYFRPQQAATGKRLQQQAKKSSAHLIKNRNAVATSKHLKSKQGKRLDTGLLPVTTTTQSPLGFTMHPVQVNVTAKVGETVILACTINSSGYNGLNPGVIWMQGQLGNVLTLNTDRITVDHRFEIVQQPLSAQHFHMTHRERPSPPSPLSSLSHSAPANHASKQDNEDAAEEASQDHTSQQQQKPAQYNNEGGNNYYHLKITNVQLYDENEYACESSITKRNEDQPSLHSLVYLHVTQSPSFIETLTSESNLAANEYTDVIIKCFAVGKPMPKIRWYEIDESNGSIRDLNHEATSLTIKNISKSDSSKYECVASNGILPSVSKKFTITVYYAPIVKPVLQKTNQYMEQTVALGCVINSNPESNVNWLRQLNVVVAANRTLSPHAVFEPIETGSSAAAAEAALTVHGGGQKYQIHKYKQANQTVSYLKIKITEPADYTKYKCEASNSIGKSETIIELLELKEASVTPRNRYRPNKPILNTLDSNEGSYDDGEDLLDGNGPNELFINLGSGRDRNENNVGNEYQIVGGTGAADSSRTKPSKMGNLVGGGGLAGTKNRTLYKYQISKTNRIVSTGGSEDDESNSIDDGDGNDDSKSSRSSSRSSSDLNDDSEHNTNRLNSYLSSESSSRRGAESTFWKLTILFVSAEFALLASY